jgi:hypothetical protein
MRTFLVCGFLFPALFAFAGCGGGTGHFADIDGGPGGPDNDAAPGDDSVTLPGDDVAPGDDIGPPPFDDGGPVDPRCASGSPIGTGLACGLAGLACPLGTVTDCNGNGRTLECFCNGTAWNCDPVPVAPECPPPTACPDPSTVYPGSGCDVAIGQQCVSTDIPSPGCGGELPPPMKGVCTCTSSGWSCPVMPTPCPPPMACPDPYSVYEFTYCNSYGITCPGNPQTCGSQIYYDAFQCSNNGWESVATTFCGIDGGAEDAAAFLDAAPAEHD